MEKILSIIGVFIIFVSFFLASSSLGRKKGTGYIVGGLISFLIMGVFFFTSPRDSNLRAELESGIDWLLPAMLGGQLMAHPLLQKRAGNLIARLNDITQKSRRWMLLFLISILILLFLSTIPNLRAYPTGELIYDERFFASRLPMWTMYLLLITATIFWVLAKGEVRERGIVFMNQFIDWHDIESYSWYILDSQIRLSLRAKYKFGAYPTIYLVKEERQSEIDEFLKRKGIPKLDL